MPENGGIHALNGGCHALKWTTEPGAAEHGTMRRKLRWYSVKL